MTASTITTAPTTTDRQPTERDHESEVGRSDTRSERPHRVPADVPPEPVCQRESGIGVRRVVAEVGDENVARTRLHGSHTPDVGRPSRWESGDGFDASLRQLGEHTHSTR